MIRKSAQIIGAALLAVTLFYTLHNPKQPAVLAASTQPAAKFVVAAGRVEPASEEIKIASQLDGKLRAVPVEEGDLVHKGQVLAVLDNADFAARVELAAAEVRQREAALARVMNGSRPEQRRESAATVREAEAVLENARAERDRRTRLLDTGAISRTEFDSADREFRVAQARLDAMRERRALVDDESRIEDKQGAAAELDRAKAQLNEARAMAEKTYIRSPIDGVVLRKKLKAGESVSGKGDTPIVTLGDLSRLRVRADIDETDVSRIAVGQKAYVTAPAYGDRRFTGHVIRIGEILGRKNVRTDEPTERLDQKILETLIELDPGQKLPAGLRIDAYIEANGRS